MNILDFIKRKKSATKISMVTCYDYPFAKILDSSDVDCILVGDSVAMAVHGHPTTLTATLDMMCLHTAAVAKGISKKFIVADMPFLTFRSGLLEGTQAAGALMRSGAHAVKIEGARGNLDLVKHLTESGIPVMGHLGLTPQSLHALGGFKVQAKELSEQELLFQDAMALQNAGCFALVLECIPAAVATKLTKELSIPTIGIGAGAGTDGQVLVLQDLLGLNLEFKPKFVRTYMPGFEATQTALNNYAKSVQSGEFPTQEESY